MLDAETAVIGPYNAEDENQDNESAPAPAPKRRGRKPKPVAPAPAPEPEPEPEPAPAPAPAAKRGRKPRNVVPIPENNPDDPPPVPLPEPEPPPVAARPVSLVAPRKGSAKAARDAGIQIPAIADKFHGSVRNAMREPSVTLKTISDPIRAAVIMLLTEQESLNVTQLCLALDAESQPAISHHLALMRHSRIIDSTRVGKNNYYSLTETGIRLAEVLQVLTR